MIVGSTFHFVNNCRGQKELFTYYTPYILENSFASVHIKLSVR